MRYCHQKILYKTLSTKRDDYNAYKFSFNINATRGQMSKVKGVFPTTVKTQRSNHQARDRERIQLPACRGRHTAPLRPWRPTCTWSDWGPRGRRRWSTQPSRWRSRPTAPSLAVLSSAFPSSTHTHRYCPKLFEKRPRRRRSRRTHSWPQRIIVQPYLPGGVNVHARLTSDSLDPPTHHPKWQLDWFSRFCTADATLYLYVTLRRSFSQIFVHRPSNARLPRPARTTILNGIWIESAVFRQNTLDTKEPTGRLHYLCDAA